MLNHCQGLTNVITGVLRRGNQKDVALERRSSVIREAKIGEMLFGNEGRGPTPRCTDGLWRPEETRRYYPLGSSVEAVPTDIFT